MEGPGEFWGGLHEPTCPNPSFARRGVAWASRHEFYSRNHPIESQVAGPQPKQGANNPMKSNLAVQMFTVRDFTKTGTELGRTLAKIREIGYPAVQMSAVGA